MPHVEGIVRVKIGDVVYNSIHTICSFAQTCFCFIKCPGRNIKYGYIIKTFIQQIVHQFAVAPSNVNNFRSL